MTDPQDDPGDGSRTQTRRRGADLQRAIFEAVIEQLGTVGYARLSMEGVAAAANTGKAALYRRWDNRDALVRDALGNLLPQPPDLPEHTPLRDGLLTLLRYFDSALFGSKGAAFQAVAAESGSDVTLLRELFQTRVTDPCQDRILALLHRHTPAAPDKERDTTFAMAGPAMLMYNCISGQHHSTDQQIESIVDNLLLPLARTN
ncbi:TetR/AcrR family transcriptional regulator [Dactylosporangium fulvum]|uniref:TetR family transcriptional regulator n=1 Tax=Dactylosporangium fulvum TaxID=53359 RepID=A0ABY5W883_9ACTN|nr:TetR family transcriptional regulator [Dactylosporangium fulvum]UWP85689.1 TetR family transcriptional regulator [Dactylosporangium fulvum]